MDSFGYQLRIHNFERSASGGKLLNLYSVIFFTSTSRFASLTTLGSLKLMADPD